MPEPDRFWSTPMTDSVITLAVLEVSVGIPVIGRVPVAVVALLVPWFLWAISVLNWSKQSRDPVIRRGC